MHIAQIRIFFLLLLILSTALIPLAGCTSGITSDQSFSSNQSVIADKAADATAARDETAPPKHLGIKSFWTYDVNTIGGGGKAMAHLWGGNLVVQYTDVSFPGRGLPVEFRRTYNSHITAKGSFGKGWTSIFDTHLIFNETNGNITLADAYGTRYTFTNPQPNGNDTVYKTPAGRNTIFKKLADGTYTEKKKNGSTYVFDSAGKLTKLQHRNTNNYFQFVYDPSGAPFAIQEASGRITAIECDTAKRITKITDPQGRATSYYYAGGYLHKVVDPELHRTLFDYNDLGLLATINNPRLLVSTIAYDGQNRITEFHDPLYTVTYQYFEDRTEVTDTNDHHLIYYLNSKGNNIQTVDSMGNKTYFTWDNKMNIIRVKNAKEQEVNYTYDSRGNVLSVANSLFTMSYTYDSSNNLISTIDGRGKTTTFSYTPKPNDPDGVLDQVTTPMNRIVSFVYNDYGEPTTVINARGKSTVYTFDSNGNITDVTDAQSNTTHITYNAVGEALATTDPLGRTTTFDYYPNGQVHTVTTPPGADGTGASTEYRYDPNGNRTRIIDSLARPTSYTFDEDDRIKTVTDAKGKISVYTYEKGRLISTQDPMGFTTTMGYDANDRMTSRSNPITTETYAYDPLGNIVTKGTGLGDITYGYDAINRVVQVSMPDRTVSYTLDNNGNRTGSSVSDATGAWPISHMDFSYSYDDDNRVTNKTKTLEGTIVEQLSMGYDSNNNLTNLSVIAKTGGAPITFVQSPPDDVTFSFQYNYDDLDRQISVNNSANHTFNASYDAVGNMTNISFPEGICSTRAFDQENRISSVTNDYPIPPSSGGPNHIAYTYAYDKMGNCASVEKNPTTVGVPGPKIYKYDRLNRLIYDQNVKMRYEYDDGGNKIKDILLFSGVSVNVNYTFNNAHQVLKIESDSNSEIDTYWTYDYDSNGNRLKKTGLAYSNIYAYDSYKHNANNRLASTKYYVVDESPEGGQLFDHEIRQSFDDNDELVLSIYRDYLYNTYNNEVSVYQDNVDLFGYYNGSLLYKSYAYGGQYNYGVYDGTTLYYSSCFYTYLNGIRVAETIVYPNQTALSKSLFFAKENLYPKQKLFDQILAKNKHIKKPRKPNLPSVRLKKFHSSSSRSDTLLDAWSYFFVQDGHNNVVEVCEESGEMPFSDFKYTSYGLMGEYTNGLYPEWGGEYSGYKGYDIGLSDCYRTGVRDYDPQTGRFLQPDPFKGYLSEPASQNPYMYCRGNPVTYSDPSGYDVHLQVSKDVGGDSKINWDEVNKAITKASGQIVRIEKGGSHPPGSFKDSKGKTQIYVTITTSTANFGGFGGASGGNYAIELHQSFSNDNATACGFYGAQSDENLSNIATNKVIHEFWHALCGAGHPQSWAEDNPVHPHPHEIWTKKTLDYHKYHAERIRKKCQ